MVSFKKAAIFAAGLVLGTDAARVNKKSAKSTGVWRAKLHPGKMEMKRPAFLFFDEERQDVVVSQFGRASKPSTINPNPFPAASSISRIPVSDIAAAFKGRSFRGEYGKDALWVSTNAGLKWPNKLSRVPAEYGDYIVVPDGFLPPGKENGNIFLADRKGNVNRITAKVKGAFYHEVEWHDFNGDGLKDMLTQRVIKSGIFSFKFKGEMMWYENPGASDFTSEWKANFIAEGPDVIFKTTPYKGGLAVFCTEFFGEVPRISVRLVNTRGVQTAMRIIDDNLGKPFAVNLVDLDGDGQYELLASNHQDDEDDIKMGVFAYEINWDDLINGEYPRHTVAYDVSNIKVETAGVGAPGFAYGFYPKQGMTGPKHVICAGDGSFDVWYMRPTGRFQYETQIIDINGTTGELLLHDFDADGILDVLVPDNDYWKVHGITFEQI